jgi:DNA-binding transcriptional MocR family regulator
MTIPVVRDAVVAEVQKNPTRFYTIDELADQLKLTRDSVAGALYTLGARAAVTRRRRDGHGTAYEYAAGKRIESIAKRAGRRLGASRIQQGKASFRGTPVNGEAVPAAAGGVGIVVKIDGQAHAITLSQAKTLYVELGALFGK